MIRITKLRHAAIIARDVERMKEFYTKVLGFECVEEVSIGTDDFQRGIGVPGSSAKGIVLNLPNTEVQLEIYQITPLRAFTEEISHTNTPGIRHLAFEVENLKESYAELTAKGIQFVHEPIFVTEPPEVAGLGFAYFLDIEGNIIELNQYKN
jgi:catechol 2,3-dioxygenase-like lactoylglutathione lyase family enzyme